VREGGKGVVQQHASAAATPSASPSPVNQHGRQRGEVHGVPRRILVCGQWRWFAGCALCRASAGLQACLLGRQRQLLDLLAAAARPPAQLLDLLQQLLLAHRFEIGLSNRWWMCASRGCGLSEARSSRHQRTV
jgi:hypothetical protein